MSQFPILDSLKITVIQKVDEIDGVGLSYVHAEDLEARLAAGSRDALDLGYQETQKVYCLVSEPTIEPVKPEEVMAVLADFYKDQSGFSEQMIKSLIERVQKVGLANGTAEPVKIVKKKHQPPGGGFINNETDENFG